MKIFKSGERVRAKVSSTVLVQGQIYTVQNVYTSEEAIADGRPALYAVTDENGERVITDDQYLETA
jgi:hypothetical protein